MTRAYLFSYKVPSFYPLRVHITVKHFLSVCYASGTVLSPADTEETEILLLDLQPSQGNRLQEPQKHVMRNWGKNCKGKGQGALRTWGAWFHQVTKKAALPKWLRAVAPRKGRRWPSKCYQDGKKAWIESGPLYSPMDTIVQLLIEVADFPVSLYVCRFLCKLWAASKYPLIYEDLSSVLPPASCLPSGVGSGWV